MARNSPEQSLLGYIIDADVSGTPIDEKSVCEIAEDIRKGILCKIAALQLDPGRAVEIDGEKWDYVGLLRELRNLYEWTFKLCGMEDGAAAVSIIPARCEPRSSCCD